MYSKALSLVKTKDDLDDLKDELALLLASLYKKSQLAFEEALNSQVRSSTSALVTALLKESGLAKEELLKGLIKELESVGIVRITVPSELSEKGIEKINRWLEENVAGKKVIEFNYDESLIAGAIVINQGEYRDFSFKHVFREKVLEENSLIKKLLGVSAVENN